MENTDYQNLCKMRTYTANYENLKTGESFTLGFTANSLTDAKTLAQNNKRHSKIEGAFTTRVFWSKNKLTK